MKEFSRVLNEVMEFIQSHTDSAAAALIFLEKRRTVMGYYGFRCRSILEWLAHRGEEGLRELRKTMPFWIEELEGYEKKSMPISVP